MAILYHWHLFKYYMFSSEVSSPKLILYLPSIYSLSSKFSKSSKIHPKFSSNFNLEKKNPLLKKGTWETSSIIFIFCCSYLIFCNYLWQSAVHFSSNRKVLNYTLSQILGKKNISKNVRNSWGEIMLIVNEMLALLTVYFSEINLASIQMNLKYFCCFANHLCRE